MLLDGEAKLVDFGLAKMSAHSKMGTSVQGMRRVVQRGTYCIHPPRTPHSLHHTIWCSNRKSSLVTRRNHTNLQLDEPRAGKADDCSRVVVAALELPLPPFASKTFTACADRECRPQELHHA